MDAGECDGFMCENGDGVHGCEVMVLCAHSGWYDTIGPNSFFLWNFVGCAPGSWGCTTKSSTVSP